jgi:hypothetical protein
LALTPIVDEETATRELFRTVAAQAYVSQERRLRAAQNGHANISPALPAIPKHDSAII